MYQYSALPEGVIRILTLHPGQLSDPISISLHDYDLELMEDTYEALSYTWGNPTKTFTIHCNGDHIRITASLEEAMRHLRHDHEARRLWIDAVCINQESVKERNAQVPLMRYIYPQASRVLVWLGCEDPSTKSALETFAELSGCYKKDWVDTIASLERVLSNDQSFQVKLKMAASLTFRPWFDRCWTFQEIILAREATLLCGSSALDWRDFDHGFDVLDLARLRNRKSFKCNENAARMIAVNYNKTNRHEVFPLSKLLLETVLLQAKDPRDKIFSLLGLIKFGKPSLFRPRYDASIRETYIVFTKAIIKEESSLNILTHSRKHVGAYDLPSWVPEWSNNIMKNSFGRWSNSYGILTNPPHRHGFSYNVHGGYEQRFESADLDSIDEIALRGVYIDTIKECHDLHQLREELSRLRHSSMDWYFPPNLHHFVKEFALEKHVACGGAPPEVILYRTLSAGRWYFGPQERVSKKDYLHHERLFRHSVRHVGEDLSNVLNTTLDLNKRNILLPAARQVYGEGLVDAWASEMADIQEEASNFTMATEAPADMLRDVSKEALRAPMNFIQGRSLFYTDRGYIGLASQAIRPGDILCTLFGADVPFILRPCEGQIERFAMIGECYVDGIMSGELFNVSEDHKSIEPVVVEIEIRDFTLI